MNNQKKIVSLLLLIGLLAINFLNIFAMPAYDSHSQDIENEIFLFYGYNLPIEYLGYTEDITALISIQWETGKIRTVVFAPNTTLNIPDFGEGSLTNAYDQGGVDLLADSIINKYDIEINAKIAFNFDGTKELIDELDGLELEITDEDLTNELIISGIDSTGFQTMNSDQITAYLSTLSSSPSEQANKKLENIASALNDKRDDLDLGNILSILDILSDNLETDLNLIEKTKLINKALGFSPSESRTNFYTEEISKNKLYKFLYYLSE